ELGVLEEHPRALILDERIDLAVVGLQDEDLLIGIDLHALLGEHVGERDDLAGIVFVLIGRFLIPRAAAAKGQERERERQHQAGASFPSVHGKLSERRACAKPQANYQSPASWARAARNSTGF